MGQIQRERAEREARQARERLIIRLYNLTRNPGHPSLFETVELLAEHIDDDRVSALVREIMRRA